MAIINRTFYSAEKELQYSPDSKTILFQDIASITNLGGCPSKYAVISCFPNIFQCKGNFMPSKVTKKAKIRNQLKGKPSGQIVYSIQVDFDQLMKLHCNMAEGI